MISLFITVIPFNIVSSLDFDSYCFLPPIWHTVRSCDLHYSRCFMSAVFISVLIYYKVIRVNAFIYLLRFPVCCLECSLLLDAVFKYDKAIYFCICLLFVSLLPSCDRFYGFFSLVKWRETCFFWTKQQARCSISVILYVMLSTCNLISLFLISRFINSEL